MLGRYVCENSGELKSILGQIDILRKNWNHNKKSIRQNVLFAVPIIESMNVFQ